MLKKWTVPLLAVILLLLALPVLGVFAEPDAPTTSSTEPKQAAKPFSEEPSSLAATLLKHGDTTETIDGKVKGRTTVYSDTALDPGPSGVVMWFRVQDINSNLKPIWEGKGWWLDKPEKKTVQINGVPVILDYNIDTGTFEGKPYQQTWLKGSWVKEGKEYQMLGINVSVADFVKMANSVN
jgi:hypothetical protein